MCYSSHSVILCFITPITNIESCPAYNELSEIKQGKIVKNDIQSICINVKTCLPVCK